MVAIGDMVIHSAADDVTLVIFGMSCILGFLRLGRLLVFCIRTTTEINGVDKTAHARRNVDDNDMEQLKILSKKIRRVLRWWYIPYITQHYLWHEPEEIQTLLSKVHEVVQKMNESVSDSSRLEVQLNMQEEQPEAAVDHDYERMNTSPRQSGCARTGSSEQRSYPMIQIPLRAHRGHSVQDTTRNHFSEHWASDYDYDSPGCRTWGCVLTVEEPRGVDFDPGRSKLKKAPGGRRSI